MCSGIVFFLLFILKYVFVWVSVVPLKLLEPFYSATGTCGQYDAVTVQCFPPHCHFYFLIKDEKKELVSMIV